MELYFYRDTINFNNMTKNEDLKETKKSYTKTFGATRPWALSYIIVNRSSKIDNYMDKALEIQSLGS